MMDQKHPQSLTENNKSMQCSNISRIKRYDSLKALFENQLFTYKQAAQHLAISESYLRRLKNKGLIAFVQVGDRGVRFRVSSLNRWIEKREVT